MKNTIKTIALSIVLALFFINVSCLTTEERVQRTPELELTELSKALANLEADGYDIDTTDLGIFYIVHEEGSGARVVAGNTISLQYAGYLLNGTLFDASSDHYEDGIWTFTYKDVALIPGFDDGIALMNKGMELDIIIPSIYAYGASGSGIIPPYSTLIFSLKMHDIKTN